MNEYSITFARSSRKELEELQAKIADRIFRRIEELSRDPRPTGCRKLEGETNLWRIRIGDYRVIYSVDDKGRIVDIISIRHRSEAYR